MANQKVLVVDDEEDILELLKFNLSREGYQVPCAASGEQAFRLVRSESPDLIVLDLMLPGIDGLEVTRCLKNDPDTKNIPIVMLTAKGEEADIVTGLELGADDYITKPFSPRIVLARVRAVLRRKIKGQLEETSVLRIHDLEIDPDPFPDC
jgi:two-component system phosphate regulon response regulator PhoB